MYSYIFFGLMMVGIFSIIENLRNGHGFSNIRMYIILFLSFITINSFLDFLSEFGYDFKLLESIIGLSALISFINLFYFIANRKIPKAVIVLECLMFVFFIITYIFGYYSTSITSGNLLIELSVIDKIKFLIKVAFYSISMCYNIFIIYKNTDNDNLYQVKIKNWIIFLIVLFFIAISVQITGLLIYYKKFATPLFDSRAVVSLVRFVLLLFILFRPKFLNESGYTAKINKIIGINNRNLKTFDVDLENSVNLANQIPEDCLKISESGLSDPRIITGLKEYGFNGFLIGENFMKTENPGEACEMFINQIR